MMFQHAWRRVRQMRVLPSASVAGVREGLEIAAAAFAGANTAISVEPSTTLCVEVTSPYETVIRAT